MVQDIQVSSGFPPVSMEQEPQGRHSDERYKMSKKALPELLPTFFNTIASPVSQVLAPPRVSVDSYPQNVQTSPLPQGLQQNEVLTRVEALSDEPPSLEVYIAYAYQDEEYFKVIKKLLVTVTHQVQGCKIYCLESEVARSNKWRGETYLTTAHLILLLVSSDFLNSEFCYCPDMKSVVDKHKDGYGNVCILPIIVKFAESQLEGAPFGCLEALPTDHIPIEDSPNKNRIYDEIFKEIKQTVMKLKPFLKK